MKDVNVTRFIIETTPNLQGTVTETLDTFGAAVQRLSWSPNNSHGQTHARAREVILEAVLEPAKAASVVHALGSISRDGSEVRIIVSTRGVSELSNEQAKIERFGRPREEKWGDYLITV